LENLLIFKKNDYFPRKSCVFQIFVVPLPQILKFGYEKESLITNQCAVRSSQFGLSRLSFFEACAADAEGREPVGHDERAAGKTGSGSVR